MGDQFALCLRTPGLGATVRHEWGQAAQGHFCYQTQLLRCSPMPAFDPEQCYEDEAFFLFQNGFVHRYWRLSVLEKAVEWLTAAGYQIVRFDMSSRTSTIECLRDLGAALEFPTYGGRSLDAFADQLFDLALYEYGSRRDSMGTVLVLERFDVFFALDHSAADALLDIFAHVARVGALIGHRMLCLVQSDDSDIRLKEVGATPVGLTQPERFKKWAHDTSNLGLVFQKPKPEREVPQDEGTPGEG
jgi:hypothetical protein